MNEPLSRRRLPAVAATAAALAAVLLAAPGAAIAAEPAVPGHGQSALDGNGLRFDYDQDGLHDLVTVRRSDGALLLHSGDGTGRYTGPTVLSTGWGGRDVVMAGDLTGDGIPDLLARDTRTGALSLYPGDGDGFAAPVSAGTGWNGMGAITSAGDFDEDGDFDLLAVRKSDGKLYFYPGNGAGGFGSRVQVGTGWNVMDTLSTVGDYNGDGYDDLYAHDSRTGVHYLYPGKAGGSFGTRVSLTASLNPGNPANVFTEVTGGGDEDLVGLDLDSGVLVHFALTSAGKVGEFAGSGLGWGAYRLPTASPNRTYDYNSDGRSDLVAQDGDTMYIYPGTGAGAVGGRISQGVAMEGDLIRDFTTGGDLDHDGFADILIGDTNSALFVYRGDGTGIEGTSLFFGNSDWGSMAVVVAGHDYNADGRDDVLATDYSGVLWLYPGAADSRLGSRVKIGTGWNSMREVTAAGDLDHDGRADLLAIRKSDNCMYFYAGKGNGSFNSGVKVGCGWGGYNSATAVGDFNGDGRADLVARRASDGALFLYAGTGTGSLGARTQIGTGWNAMEYIA
ncbi:VCBS repeat-containing protein [Glycomyces sp. NPDC047010]|uniref:FG-GAP repeat domain-containing protein n=1 Tax=Glycomyces sp. NPDC047010 TaxID=3155023 RepID=UPI0033F07B10